MASPTLIFHRLTLALSILIGVWLTVGMGAHLLRDSSKVANWGSAGTVDSELREQVRLDTLAAGTVLRLDSVMVFSDVQEVDFTDGRVPAVGDTVLSVNGREDTEAAWQAAMNRIKPRGETIQLDYLHYGRPYSATITTHAVTRGQFLMMLGLHTLRFLIGFSFLVVGFIALRRLSSSAGVRSLTLFTFSMAAFSLAGISYLASYYVTILPNLPEFLGNFDILTLFIGAFWLNLHLEFPHKSGLMKRRAWLGYLLCYGPPLLVFVLEHMTGMDRNRLMMIGSLVMAVQMLAGFALLGLHHGRARSALEKRQTKLVQIGASIAFSPLLILLILSIVVDDWVRQLGLEASLLVINLVFACLLALPLTLLYAFNRYGLLDVEAKLRRGTRHLAITAGVLAAFFFIVYLAGDLLLRNLNVQSRTPIILIAMVLTLAVHPAQRWLTDVIERRFFPARHQLRAMLDDLTERLSSFPDRDTLWRQIGTRLRHAVGVERVVPLMRAADDCFHSYGDHPAAPFSANDELIKRLERERRPILLDEAMASLRVPFTDGQIRWISENRVNLVLPLFVRGRLSGLVTLGRSTRGQDYTPEIVGVLHNMMQQVALTVDNLRLLEENLSKKRLEEELRLARSIQEGFLPQDIPDTPGLDIGARSRFSLEVAGDYFDVIALPDGRTVIALGDVSGKGAGAALIMANLQASLRALVRVNVDLASLVGSINDIIVQNTPTEEYITFVVGLFDPATRSFSYVNAGHNPPLVFTAGGDVRELNTGGLILGVLPGSVYEVETISMQEGDRVFLYTDGISEAMNASGEEFGEERIQQFIGEQNGSACADVVSTLEQEVLRFHGNAHLEDDCTMVLARVHTSKAEAQPAERVAASSK